MSARTREIPSNAVAEQLFMLGGEEMRPFYFQPGRDPDHDRKFPFAYVVEDASIDEMSLRHQLVLPSSCIFIRRDQIAARVRANLRNAERIEAARQHLASEFRKMVLRQTVDLTE